MRLCRHRRQRQRGGTLPLHYCISWAIRLQQYGRESTHGYLASTGANRILSRDEFASNLARWKTAVGRCEVIPGGDKGALARITAQMRTIWRFIGRPPAAARRAASRCRPPLCHSFCVMCVLQGWTVMTHRHVAPEAQARLVGSAGIILCSGRHRITLADAPKFAVPSSM